MAFQEDPPSQVEMSRKLGISPRPVGRILKEKIGAKQVKKTNVHALTAKQAEQRLDRGKKFVKFVSRRKVKYLLTMDETMISTDDVKDKKTFYFKSHEVVRPERWRCLLRQNWPKQIMLATAIC